MAAWAPRCEQESEIEAVNDAIRIEIGRGSRGCQTPRENQTLEIGPCHRAVKVQVAKALTCVWDRITIRVGGCAAPDLPEVMRAILLAVGGCSEDIALQSPRRERDWRIETVCSDRPARSWRAESPDREVAGLGRTKCLRHLPGAVDPVGDEQSATISGAILGAPAGGKPNPTALGRLGKGQLARLHPLAADPLEYIARTRLGSRSAVITRTHRDQVSLDC